MKREVSDKLDEWLRRTYRRGVLDGHPHIKQYIADNSEPIKVGDWAKPAWDPMGPCLVVAVGLDGADTIMALRHCHREEIDSVRWAVGGDWTRCDPHPDPEIRARIEKAAGR